MLPGWLLSHIAQPQSFHSFRIIVILMFETRKIWNFATIKMFIMMLHLAKWELPIQTWVLTVIILNTTSYKTFFFKYIHVFADSLISVCVPSFTFTSNYPICHSFSEPHWKNTRYSHIPFECMYIFLNYN